MYTLYSLCTYYYLTSRSRRSVKFALLAANLRAESQDSFPVIAPWLNRALASK